MEGVEAVAWNLDEAGEDDGEHGPGAIGRKFDLVGAAFLGLGELVFAAGPLHRVVEIRLHAKLHSLAQFIGQAGRGSRGGGDVVGGAFGEGERRDEAGLPTGENAGAQGRGVLDLQRTEVAWRLGGRFGIVGGVVNRHARCAAAQDDAAFVEEPEVFGLGLGGPDFGGVGRGWLDDEHLPRLGRRHLDTRLPAVAEDFGFASGPEQAELQAATGKEAVRVECHGQLGTGSLAPVDEMDDDGRIRLAGPGADERIDGVGGVFEADGRVAMTGQRMNDAVAQREGFLVAGEIRFAPAVDEVIHVGVERGSSYLRGASFI